MLDVDAMRRFLTILLVIAAPARFASADDRCSQADVDLAWTGTDFAQMSADTGWFPSGFAAQLRLTGRVVGQTAVLSGMTTKACWAEQMTATATGRGGSGWFDVEYGAEVHLYARIDTTILGQHFNWEGEIPIPVIPTDLLSAGSTTFDPSLGGVSARVSDATSPITLMSTDVISQFIGIPGISGGLRLTGAGSVTTTYQANTLHLGNGTIDANNSSVKLTAGPAGYAGAIDLDTSLDGTVHYGPQLIFGASFDVKILGIRVVNWNIASFTMDLPGVDRAVTLTGTSAAHLTLPDLDGIGAGARMDFASAATQQLPVRNKGEAPLVIEPAVVPPGMTVQKLVVAPGADAMLAVTVDGSFAGSAQLVLVSNDPDHKKLTVDVGKDVGGTDPGDVEDPAAHSGGCSAGGAPQLGALLLALGLVVARRRR